MALSTQHTQQLVRSGIQISEALPEGLIKTLFENLGCGAVYQTLNGDVQVANHTAIDLLGVPESLIFDTKALENTWTAIDGLGETMNWSDFPSFTALQTGVSMQGFVLGVVANSKPTTWLRVDSILIHRVKDERYLGVLSTISDITLERKIQTETNKMTDRLRLALDGAHIGIWDWYIRDHKMVWDDRMYALYGFEGKTHIPIRSVWERAVSADDRERIEKLLRKARHGTRLEKGEFTVNLPDGRKRHLRAQARGILDENNQLYRVVGINWDVTKEVESERRLKEMAFQDDLTQLPNRVAFNFELNKQIARSRKTDDNFVVLVMDLDNFKDINDSFGHPVGDAVLCEVVNRVTPLLDSKHLIARLSGDEFGILLNDSPSDETCLKLLIDIQKCLQEPFYVSTGATINIKASMGLSCYPADANDAVGLIKMADLAMYKAKDGGRDQFTWYDKEMSVALNKKVTMENKLREALRDEEFKLYYQPIVDLNSLKVVGCEALIRWIDKEGNFISPLDFISVAEKCGLIYELGAWVNYTAFKQFCLWQVINTSLEYVSVNVSPHQLQSQRFISDLMETVEKTRIKPNNIQLEITEGTFLQESLNTSSHLSKLAEAGFHLAIDDFGTGYSSLSYLKRFNVDVIKIDKSFIDDIETDQADKDIVKAIMAMTSSLGFKTLVEGVERAEQAKIVKQYGCGFAQGYFYGKPMEAEIFAETFIGLKDRPH